MNCKTTILTVNWNSADMLAYSLKNLTTKSEFPNNLRCIIIDNTNGRDKKLDNINIPGLNITVIKNNPGKLKGLHAHAHGLNCGFEKINTEYTLIVDPDIHVFKQNWDSFLLDIVKTQKIDALGTCFPRWWLGTYHNFPSPIFCLAKTDSLKEIDADWLPPQINIFFKLKNLLIRQLLRGFFLFNRRQLNSSPSLRKLTKVMESALPVCTLDTGYQLSRKSELKNILFNALYPDEISSLEQFPKQLEEVSLELARNFELYCYENEPLLTHQYGSQNFLLKTAKGKDREYWQELIGQFEQTISTKH